MDGDPKSWDDASVRGVLVEILRAIERVDNPQAPPDRSVALRGISWIVEPNGEKAEDVVIAIEIPMGAAVAGPFAIAQVQLSAMIGRVIQAERQAIAPQTIH